MSGGFERLGDIVARLKADVEAAIRARDEEAADDAHKHLCEVEHRQRTIETVRKYRNG